MLSFVMSKKASNGASAAHESERWAAVAKRDAKADGTFVYAVVTTGIYCRPSCPSRHALPKNVRFFATPADAEGAGFRACKRCKPNSPRADSGHARDIETACRRIEEAIEAGDSVPGLAELAEAANLSRFHFHRIFKDATGVTPRGYAAAQKAKLMRSELRDNERVTDAIYGAGYSSASRFYESARARLGMAASAYRDGGRGACIKFAVGDCSLGAILVAATEHGVCQIAFGDDPQTLIEALQRRFPKATLIGGDAGFDTLVATVVGFVEQPERRSICRSTCRARRSRNACGGRCGRSHRARRRPIRISRPASGSRSRCARSPKRVPATRWQWRSRAIASCG